MHGATRSFGCPESEANALERFVREKKKGDAGYATKNAVFYGATNETVSASKKQTKVHEMKFPSAKPPSRIELLYQQRTEKAMFKWVHKRSPSKPR